MNITALQYIAPSQGLTAQKCADWCLQQKIDRSQWGYLFALCAYGFLLARVWIVQFPQHRLPDKTKDIICPILEGISFIFIVAAIASEVTNR